MHKNKQAVNKYQSYLFFIKKYSVDYSLSLDHSKYAQGHYSEYSSLIIEAECTFPEKECGNAFKLVFLCNRDIEDSFHVKKEIGRKPIAVGSLTIKMDRRNFLGSIPSGPFWGIHNAIERGSIKLIGLHGDKLRYGKSPIISFSFSEAHDPDEL